MRAIHKPRTRSEKRARRHLRVRKKLMGTPDRPRLVVRRSLKHIYAQIVDDTANRTLLSVSDLRMAEGKKSERCLAVGKELAARAKEAGIARVVFDRAGYKYHGRVRAVADGAREGGLEF
jgi:large subunit ribosomal protein L18